MFSPTVQHNCIFIFDEHYTLPYKSSTSHIVISFTPYQRFLKLTGVLQFLPK